MRNCQRISLDTRDIIPRVLATRIALLLKYRIEENLYSRIIRRIRGKCNGLTDILRQMGLSDVDQLPQFEYPFTEKHNMFMRRITNGNLREVFDIAMDSLIYMFDSRNSVELRSEHGVERRSIGREGDLQLFMDPYDRKVSQYSMYNLHKVKSRSGNSLLFNVLELVKIRQVVDDTFYEFAAEYGHLRRDVDFAIKELADRANRFISPARLRPARTSGGEGDVPEYRISEKGDYYLQICENWTEYIRRCGLYGKSVQKEYKP